MAWENVLPSRNRTSIEGRDVANQLAYSVVKAAKTSKSKQVSFIIGANLLKKARFKEGDMMAVYKDGDMGLIRRENGNGNFRKLSSPSNCKNPSFANLSVKLQEPFVEVPHIVILEHEVTGEGIEFVWPKEGQTE